MINFHERKHDIEGRNILRKICIGRGLDVGSADRPITKDVTTVDKDITIHPNIVADMSNIPLDDCTQNFIISSHSLEHTDNTIDTLREWYRLLKVGGKLGIMVPHGEYVDSEDLGDSSHTHKTLFTVKTLELFLKYTKFKEVKVNKLERPLAYNKTPAIIAFASK